MKKAELIDAIQAQKPRLSKAEIQSVIDGLTAAAKAAATQGMDFAIPGVVRLEVATRGARVGRNPRTGEAIDIRAKNAYKAKVSGEMNNAMPPA